MPSLPQAFSQSPEELVVALARLGDRDAFEELVKRRQSWVRALMRRCCGNTTLADDLAQQVFLQAWQDIRRLRQAKKFGPWLKRLAINVWRQHLRKNDVLKNSAAHEDDQSSESRDDGIALDLNKALDRLSNTVRLCIVLSYHEGMTHGEIAEVTRLPVGTVKSHIRRGSERLKEFLSAYQESQLGETT